MPYLQVSMQKLIIRNFGPIKNVELDVNDFMVFIGPQASGKSTIAKVLFFFKFLRQEFSYFLFESVIANDRLKKSIEANLASFAPQINDVLTSIFPSAKLGNDYYLRFDYAKDVYIEIKRQKPAVSFSFSPLFSPLFQERFELLVADIRKIANDANAIPGDENDPSVRAAKVNFLRAARNLMQKSANEIFQDDTYLTFIPAGRSVFSNLKNLSLQERHTNLDFTVREFLNEATALDNFFTATDYDAFNYVNNQTEIKNSSFISAALNLVQNVLKGFYSAKDGIRRIHLDKNSSVALEDASSGQQESLWILLVLLERIFYSTSSCLFIEEPEAHLFPEAQRQVVDLIALFANSSKSQTVITTHSPYILAAINNLIYASKVGKEKPESVNRIIEKEFWLKYEKVSCYFVDNGTIRNIMDDELQMIKNEEIDTASTNLNNAYDKISDIEFAQ
jgi:predicted ATPase